MNRNIFLTLLFFVFGFSSLSIAQHLAEVTTELSASSVLTNSDSVAQQKAFTPKNVQKSAVDTLAYAIVDIQEFPSIIQAVKPLYPESAVKDGIEGTVVVKLWIDRSGVVKKAAIAQGIRPDINEAARQAALSYRFKPGFVNGPLSCWVTLPFLFKNPKTTQGILAPAEGNLSLAFMGYWGPLKTDNIFLADAPISTLAMLDTKSSIRMENQKTAPDDFIQSDQPPTIKSSVEPHYPEAAIRDNISGTVTVKVWVDQAGNVVEVRKVSGVRDDLDAAAMDAAKKYVFTPASLQGKPIDVWVTIPFRFKNPTIVSTEKAALKLQTLIENILIGKELKNVRASISVDTYVIDGKYFESIFDAISDHPQNCKLIEGRDCKILFQKLTFTENLSAAFLVAKTSSLRFGERFHSVVFFKEKTDDWKIKSWHTSK